MGLFHRPTVAQASEGHSFVNVIQNEGGNTGRGIIAWRDPRSDFNTHSKLLVRKGEEAVFENGASEWAVFPEGTECELKTQNIAFIRSLREALSGGQSYFPCRVYFVSTEEYEIPWGTREPIGYTCPVIGEGAQLMGGGIYVIRITDTETFVKKVLRDNQSYTVDDLKIKLFDRVYQEIADIVSSVLEENNIISMECSKKKKEIAKLCMPGVQELLYQYGLHLIDFTISLSLDEQQRQMFEEKIRGKRMDAQGDAQARIIGARSKIQEMDEMGARYTTIKGMDILESMANNPGSGDIAGMGAGLGMGMAAAGAFKNITESIFPNTQTPQPATNQQTPSSPDPIESLSKLKTLLEKGLISETVYKQKEAEILSRL